MAIYKGVNAVVQVDTADDGGGGASWVTIGQRRGGESTVASETVDSTHAGNAGWASATIVETSQTITVDGVLDFSGTAYAFLRGKARSGVALYVKNHRSNFGGADEVGSYVISSHEETFNNKELVAFSVEFVLDGAIT